MWSASLDGIVLDGIIGLTATNVQHKCKNAKCSTEPPTGTMVESELSFYFQNRTKYWTSKWLKKKRWKLTVMFAD